MWMAIDPIQWHHSQNGNRVLILPTLGELIPDDDDLLTVQLNHSHPRDLTRDESVRTTGRTCRDRLEAYRERTQSPCTYRRR